MEAILLAGGKAERLGDAARGLPKALVRIGDRPLASYQIELLATGGVGRVLVSCAAGQGELFAPSSRWARSRDRHGRGAGAARSRRRPSLRSITPAGEGPTVWRSTGTSCSTSTFPRSCSGTRRPARPRPMTVSPLRSAFGVVEVDDDVVIGFREAPRLPYWVNCGLYVLGEEALERLPERGDHERTTFPELAAERRLRAYFHEGIWLTVNTPKELRQAEEFLNANPEWRPS